MALIITIAISLSIIGVLVFLLLILYSQNKLKDAQIAKRIFHARNIYHLEILIDEYPAEKLEIESHRNDLKNITNDLRKDGLYKHFVKDLIGIEKAIQAKENTYNITQFRKQLQFN